MYTVERTDRQSVSKEEAGSGEFVSIVDLENFSWSTCPSLSLMKECMNLLKKHYPYRMGSIFIVNAGLTFNVLWNILKPLMPRRALAKTFNVGKANSKYARKMFEEKIGSRFLEKAYGGEREVDEGLEDIEAYFARGYWSKQKQQQR